MEITEKIEVVKFVSSILRANRQQQCSHETKRYRTELTPHHLTTIISLFLHDRYP